MLYNNLRKAIDIVNELLSSDELSSDAKIKLIQLKEVLFMLKDDVIQLRIEVSEINECIERVSEILKVKVVQPTEKQSQYFQQKAIKVKAISTLRSKDF